VLLLAYLRSFFVSRVDLFSSFVRSVFPWREFLVLFSNNIKYSPDDTIGDLKKIVAAQTGALPRSFSFSPSLFPFSLLPSFFTFLHLCLLESLSYF